MGRQESPCATTNHVQNQLCSLACLAQLCSQPHSLFLPPGRMPTGVGETPSRLEMAIFTSAWALVLSSSPFLPLQVCLLLQLLPPNSHLLGVVIKGKKKKKSQCPGMGISRELGISARQLCQPCPLPHGHRTSQSLRCMLTMHFYECSFYRCF